MNNNELWLLLNILIRKDREGGSITPNEFELLLREGSIELYDILVPLYEQNQDVTNAFLPFIKTETIDVDANGYAPLTIVTGGDYGRFVSAYYNDGTRDRRIKFVSQAEFNKRLTSFLNPATTQHPMCTVFNGPDANPAFIPALYIQPRVSDTIELTYLILPTEPVFDYCYDDNDVFYYMESAYSIDASNQLRDAYLNIIATNVTHPTVTARPYASQSVELLWREQEKKRILYNILQKLGVNLNEQDALQYGLLKEKE